MTVSQLAITNTANVASTTPGSVVRFTATFTNTGQAPYTGITISTNAADVFDDATPNGDQTATSGTLAMTGNAVTWTGNIPVGGTVTLTGTVTVNNPDTGNHAGQHDHHHGGGQQLPGRRARRRVLGQRPGADPGAEITTAASTTTVTPGQQVTVTVTVADTGQTPYAAAAVTDNLAGVLDDAAYDGDAAATAGTVTYTAPVLSWTGALSPGGTAMITFTVTVNNPDTGDKLLVITSSSTSTGSSCPPASPNAGCSLTVAVLTPALTIARPPARPRPPPAAGQLHRHDRQHRPDCLHRDHRHRRPGRAIGRRRLQRRRGRHRRLRLVRQPAVTWTGNLAPGATATITFTATVNNPDTGNRLLTTLITSAAAGNNCPAGSTDPPCATTVPVDSADQLTFAISSGAASAVTGGVVDYTITVTNAAATPYSEATFTDDLAGVLDDAAYNGNVAASTGTVSFTSPDLTWTGTVPANSAVTITYSVTVNNPDAGSQILTNTLASASAGSNCRPGAPTRGARRR